jgi:hypothetical protein
LQGLDAALVVDGGLDGEFGLTAKLKSAGEVTDPDTVVVSETGSAGKGYLQIVDEGVVATGASVPVSVLDKIIAADARDDRVPPTHAVGLAAGFFPDHRFVDHDVAPVFPSEDDPISFEGNSLPLFGSGKE